MAYCSIFKVLKVRFFKTNIYFTGESRYMRETGTKKVGSHIMKFAYKKTMGDFKLEDGFLKKSTILNYTYAKT